MSREINKPIGIRCADIYLRFPEIMEEECNDLAEYLEDEHIFYEGATDVVLELQQENKQLKDRIDKVIKIISYDLKYYEKDVIIRDLTELLEILRGTNEEVNNSDQR